MIETLSPDFDKMLKPDKVTVLQDYIEWIVSDDFEYAGRKIEPVSEWEALLIDYNVQFSRDDIQGDDSYID